uniref:Uncharacterized protein n=1 Tax=Ixodes ricinus TaxID=34613 RepID=A0A147BC35_IXORI
MLSCLTWLSSLSNRAICLCALSYLACSSSRSPLASGFFAVACFFFSSSIRIKSAFVDVACLSFMCFFCALTFSFSVVRESSSE